MNKDKPQLTSYRFYKKQISKIKALAKKLSKAEGDTVSDAEVVRRAIDDFNPAIPRGIPARELRKILKV